MLQPRILSVKALPKAKLRLDYETGEVKVFDVAPYMQGSWFGALKEQSYFEQVQLLPGGIGIEWPNGQDIAPHELYDNSVKK